MKRVYCKDCRFWNLPEGLSAEDNDEDRECRRHAPVATVAVVCTDDNLDVSMDYESGMEPTWPAWPLTVENEWCGEGEPR